MHALSRAIKHAGGQTALANGIGVLQQQVWNWLNRGDGRVPAEYCPAIEEFTGRAVTCEDLRPDVRWDVLRRSCIDVAAPVEEVRDAA